MPTNNLALFVIACLLAPISSPAAETILSYESRININRNATVKTTETIVIKAEGNQIKHGIQRDFITDYSSPSGQDYKTGIKIVAASRNDKPEPYRLKKLKNGLRIFLGDDNHYLEPGIHTYSIRYQSSRQIGFFLDHDEFYWHMNGNNWPLPIQETKVSIQLPGDIPDKSIELQHYNANHQTEERLYKRPTPTTVMFKSTHSLQTDDTNAFSIKWPKDFINEPDIITKTFNLSDENPDLTVNAAGFIITLTCYLLTWLKARKLKFKQPHILSALDLNISPATLGLIINRKYDLQAFTSALMNLAIKGHINIEEGAKGRFVLNKRLSSAKPTFDERALLSHLFAHERPFIELKNSNHKLIENALSSHRLATQINYEKHFFFNNAIFLLPGIFFSLISLILSQIAVSHQLHSEAPWLFFTLLITWTLGTLMILTSAYRKWKSFFTHSPSSTLRSLLLTTLFALTFISGEFIGLHYFANETSIQLAGALIILILINCCFYQRLKSPHLLGKTLINKANNLRLLFSKKQENQDQTIKSLKQFEQFLPYALALDKEHRWVKNLAETEQAIYQEADYQPRWYHSSHSRHNSYSDFAAAIGSDIRDAVTMSLNPNSDAKSTKKHKR